MSRKSEIITDLTGELHIGAVLLAQKCDRAMDLETQLRESARAFGQILSFLRGAHEEVLNEAGGVTGYRAFLDTGMTEYLWDLADQQERKINAVLQPNIKVVAAAGNV
jgi:hypothetical protein